MKKLKGWRKYIITVIIIAIVTFMCFKGVEIQDNWVETIKWILISMGFVGGAKIVTKGFGNNHE